MKEGLSLSCCSCSGFSGLLDDLAAQQTGAHRQFGFVCLDQERVETTAVLNGTKSSSRNAKTVALAESVGDQRNLAQIREEPALGLVVGVADIVANHDCLAAQFAHAGHGTPILVFL